MISTNIIPPTPKPMFSVCVAVVCPQSLPKNWSKKYLKN